MREEFDLLIKDFTLCMKQCDLEEPLKKWSKT